MSLWLRSGGRDAVVREPAPAVRRPRAAEAPGAGSCAAKPVEPAEPEPLSPQDVRRLVDSSTVLIELFDDRGARLREARGLLVSEPANVLTRFRQLLGAYRGAVKTGEPGVGAREVVGVITYDLYRDLAILEIQGGEDLSGLAAMAGPESALAPGLEVYAASPGRAVATEISESPYVAADGVSRVRLAESPPLPPAAFVALDLHGTVLGLTLAEPVAAPLVEGGEEESDPEGAAQSPPPRTLLDPLGRLVEALGRPAGLSLADASAQFFEGTFADLFQRARRAFEARDLAGAVDLIGQALDQGAREELSAETLRPAKDLLRQAVETELARRREARDVHGAAALLGVAAARFPEERPYWVQLGAARVELEEHREAVAALLEARRIDPGTDADALLQRAYLDAARKEASVGRLQLAAEWLEKEA